MLMKFGELFNGKRYWNSIPEFKAIAALEDSQN
jgi:hypothetical protein